MDNTWFVASSSVLLMVIIATPLSYLVLSLWREWAALMVVLYVVLFIGVFGRGCLLNRSSVT